MAMRKYECIGGPMDGQRAAKPGGAACFCCMDRSRKDPSMHFYRLCVSTAKMNGRRMKAKFWHYMGTVPDTERRPTLTPPARLFR